MKKAAGAFLLIVLPVFSFLLAGCGSSYDRTTFVLHQDGTAKQYIIDDADHDTGIGELRDFIEDSISAYQDGSEDTLIKLEKCDIDGGKVDIELRYASCADYAAYNGVICFDGTLAEASAAGFDVERDYMTPEGETVSYQALLSQEEEYRVLIMNEVTAVSVSGRLAAVSGNVTVGENGTAFPEPDTDPSVPEEFRTINSENAYYIYAR